MVITISETLVIGGELKGVLAADITLDYLTHLVEGIEDTDGSYAYLLDNQNNIMTYPEKSYLPSDGSSYKINKILDGRFISLAEEIEKGTDNVIKLRDFDNIMKYFFTTEISSTKWTLVFVVPSSGITSNLQTLLKGFAIAFVISILISMCIIYFFVKGMLKPVMHLTNIVRQFGEKKLDVRCDIRTKDEIGELGSSFNNMAEMIQNYSLNLEHKVEERTRELVEKNANIQESIEYARVIQQTILPDEEISKILKDYFIIWHPRDIVGGDFYWMRKFDNGFLVIVGDCTGHGVPGALMTMAVNSILDRIVDDMCYDDPAFILGELNRLLNHSQKGSGDNIQDGLDAGIICVFDNGTILYSGARISLFIIKNDETFEIKGINHTIGHILHKKIFMNHKIDFQPGMSFYLATDGVKDQIGGEKHLPFGKKGLLAVLKSIQQYSMDEQKNRIWSAYEDYKKNEPFRDDVTMFGFRI
jgi:serine phosphatase RsbU (regulator of sigma subunit)/HAMP domain-containing protein